MADKQDNGWFGALAFVLLCFVGVGVIYASASWQLRGRCQCEPSPTPAHCCKADECGKQLAHVDARFGDVWDELVEVQEQLATVKPCDCGPVKECACSDNHGCECKPSKSCECNPPEAKAQLPRRLILKRCK